jgi:FixJ family two-component response regulator
MPTPRKTIAIVDDDPAVLKAIERQLRAAGYRCATFASAEDFLALAASVGAACLLADIHLGGMTGLELALHPLVSELRLPVLLMSGSDDSVTEAAAREIAVAFLRKPIPCQQLLDSIVDTAGPPLAADDQ